MRTGWDYFTGRNVQHVVEALNLGPDGWRIPSTWKAADVAEAYSNAIRLIQAWEKSGRNTRLMKFPKEKGCPASFAEIAKDCRVLISVNDSPRIYLDEVFAPQRPWTPWDLAVNLFLKLVRDPECEKFGGPCQRSGCGKYFVRAGAKPKKYCSTDCASAASAKRSTKQKRAQEHREKIERTKKLIDRLKPKQRETWKQYVHEADPEISIKFLTRAINNGEIQPPERKEHA